MAIRVHAVRRGVVVDPNRNDVLGLFDCYSVERSSAEPEGTGHECLDRYEHSAADQIAPAAEIDKRGRSRGLTSSTAGRSPSDASATCPRPVRSTGGPESVSSSSGASGRGPASRRSMCQGKPLFSASSSSATAVRRPAGPPPGETEERRKRTEE